jgi:hypothetical protein
VLAAIGRDVLAPVAVATVVAVALLPAPRAIAWIGLLVLGAALGLVARPMGVTAAVASALLFMTVHGRPRFATTITHVWTIRASFLLGILGATAAVAASWWASKRRQRTKDHSGAERLDAGLDALGRRWRVSGSVSGPRFSRADRVHTERDEAEARQVR